MHIAKQFIWRIHDENLYCTYFEKQYDQILPLNIHFHFSKNTVCMQLTHATTKNVDTS